MNFPSVVLLLLPPLLIATTYAVFQRSARRWGQGRGYLLGFLFYWIVWCLIVPLLLIGPQRLIGRDVCFDFHGPTVSATDYVTCFVAREPAADLYALAQHDARDSGGDRLRHPRTGRRSMGRFRSRHAALRRGETHRQHPPDAETQAVQPARVNGSGFHSLRQFHAPLSHKLRGTFGRRRMPRGYFMPPREGGTLIRDTNTKSK